MDETAAPFFAYDEVQYPDALSIGITPDAIAASARVRGLQPPEPATASFLEIGCAAGVNSIAIGAAFPGARIVGFDLSAEQIGAGRRQLDAAGLGNVDLEVGDILSYPRDGEKFDYIVAHGVYTWIPEHVRAPLLELMAARLAPGGIAYIGYDALPTAAVKGALNRWLVAQTEHLPDPLDRVDATMALAGVLARHQRPLSRFKTVLDQLVADAPNYLRNYVYHDWIAEHYAPVSLPDLAKAAGAYGLAFAGDATLVDLDLSDLDKDGVAIVSATRNDPVAFNVAVDFLRGTHSFRSDLFVRADAPPPPEQFAWRKLSFAFSGTREEAVEDGVEGVKYTFRDGTGFIARPDGQKLVDLLLAHAPNELSFAELAAEAGLPETVLDQALRLGVPGRVATRHATPQPFTMRPGERPVANRIARSMLAHSEDAISLRHQWITIPEGPSRLLLVLSDGTRTRSEIAAAIGETFEMAVGVAEVDQAIAQLAWKRVFVA